MAIRYYDFKGYSDEIIKRAKDDEVGSQFLLMACMTTIFKMVDDNEDDINSLREWFCDISEQRIKKIKLKNQLEQN